MISRLASGTAGDRITCRPFDRSLALSEPGILASLNDLAALDTVSDAVKSAWQTDDGSVTVCMPLASVIHGVNDNTEVFAARSVEEPTTEAEVFDLLDTIKDAGNVPLDTGTPNLVLWAVSASVMNGTRSPQEGTARLQEGLASWYGPQQ